MSELKTKKTNKSAAAFVNSIADAGKREDAKTLLKIFKEATGLKPTMWGESIVGFGQYHYKSERSSQEGDWPLVGFSPRKQNLTLYVISKSAKQKELLKKLGKHKTSVSCLYINKLSDIHLPTLKKIVKESFRDAKKKRS